MLVIDAVLLFFFAVVVIGAPLLDAQTLLPVEFYPKLLVDIKLWFITKLGHYLLVEKPHFFVGLVAFEIFFQLPLAIANVYGILAGKSWLHTTCLIYGVSFLTTLVAEWSDFILSRRATIKLLLFYTPFVAFGVLAISRGLFWFSDNDESSGRRPILQQMKKMA